MGSGCAICHGREGRPHGNLFHFSFLSAFSNHPHLGEMEEEDDGVDRRSMISSGDFTGDGKTEKDGKTAVEPVRSQVDEFLLHNLHDAKFWAADEEEEVGKKWIALHEIYDQFVTFVRIPRFSQSAFLQRWRTLFQLGCKRIRRGPKMQLYVAVPHMRTAQFRLLHRTEVKASSVEATALPAPEKREETKTVVPETASTGDGVWAHLCVGEEGKRIKCMGEDELPFVWRNYSSVRAILAENVPTSQFAFISLAGCDHSKDRLAAYLACLVDAILRYCGILLDEQALYHLSFCLPVGVLVVYLPFLVWPRLQDLRDFHVWWEQDICGCASQPQHPLHSQSLSLTHCTKGKKEQTHFITEIYNTDVVPVNIVAIPVLSKKKVFFQLIPFCLPQSFCLLPSFRTDLKFLRPLARLPACTAEPTELEHPNKSILSSLWEGCGLRKHVASITLSTLPLPSTPDYSTIPSESTIIRTPDGMDPSRSATASMIEEKLPRGLTTEKSIEHTRSQVDEFLLHLCVHDAKFWAEEGEKKWTPISAIYPKFVAHVVTPRFSQRAFLQRWRSLFKWNTKYIQHAQKRELHIVMPTLLTAKQVLMSGAAKT